VCKKKFISKVNIKIISLVPPYVTIDLHHYWLYTFRKVFKNTSKKKKFEKKDNSSQPALTKAQSLGFHFLGQYMKSTWGCNIFLVTLGCNVTSEKNSFLVFFFHEWNSFNSLVSFCSVDGFKSISVGDNQDTENTFCGDIHDGVK